MYFPKIHRLSKYPKILHLTDKRFSEIHEHLPVGEGEIDFQKIFSGVLSGFEGKIIFEVYQNDEAIISSKGKIRSIING